MLVKSLHNPIGPRILIVRLSALGDTIHTLPLLCALRDRMPDARLTWLVEDRFAELLRGHRALDELIAVPHGWLKSPRQAWGLRRRLSAMRFDIAIDAQGLSKSAIAAWLSGAPRRIGYGKPWGREISQWLNNERVDTLCPHAVDRHLELLHPLGIREPAVRFDVPEDASERAAAEMLIERLDLQRGFAMLHPGASWPSKVWPWDRFATVAAHLDQRRQLPVLVAFGNARERNWAEQIALGAGGRVRVAPALTLRELAAVARRARLYVGSDSGPLHLAAAVGTPCVALFGPWPAERHGPYGPQHISVQKMVCQGSTRRRRRASSMYMEAIDAESVCAACDRILDREGARAA